MLTDTKFYKNVWKSEKSTEIFGVGKDGGTVCDTAATRYAGSVGDEAQHEEPDADRRLLLVLTELSLVHTLMGTLWR